VAIDWLAELTAQLEFHWEFSFRRRLQGLTDEEYFWEPVAGCWSIRPDPAMDASCTTANGRPPTRRHSRRSPGGSGTSPDRCWSGGSRTISERATSARYCQLARHGRRRYRDAGRSYAAWKGRDCLPREAGLARKVGPAEGHYSEHPYATLILHINREVIHHAAEIGVLRDL